MIDLDFAPNGVCTLALLNYINQMPGLRAALCLGSAANVPQHLTVNEMAESLGIIIDLDMLGKLDRTMSEVAKVLVGSDVCQRVASVGSCSYTNREYPGYLFPFFLNALKANDITY